MVRERTFAEALEHRRSYYSISNDSPVQDEEIVHIIRTAVKHVPSAFNSQTTRIVLLLGDEHQKLWRIVKDQLEERLSEEQYRQSQSHAECAVNILNDWSAAVNGVITGELYQLPASIMVQVAEVVRAYPGWKADDIERFKKMCKEYFYPACKQSACTHALHLPIHRQHSGGGSKYK